MRDKLAEFQSGKLSIGNLVDSLSALLDNVEEASPQWREAFKTHWWTIEQVYAVGIDRGNLNALPSESRSLLTEAVEHLWQLVEQALAGSPDHTP
jgi:hypothetical protein